MGTEAPWFGRKYTKHKDYKCCCQTVTTRQRGPGTYRECGSFKRAPGHTGCAELAGAGFVQVGWRVCEDSKLVEPGVVGVNLRLLMQDTRDIIARAGWSRDIIASLESRLAVLEEQAAKLPMMLQERQLLCEEFKEAAIEFLRPRRGPLAKHPPQISGDPQEEAVSAVDAASNLIEKIRNPYQRLRCAVDEFKKEVAFFFEAKTVIKRLQRGTFTVEKRGTCKLEASFALKKVLGEGSYSVVEKCESFSPFKDATGAVRALKEVPRKLLEAAPLTNQFDVHTHANLIHVARLYDYEALEASKESDLVVELGSGGDLVFRTGAVADGLHQAACAVELNAKDTHFRTMLRDVTADLLDKAGSLPEEKVASLVHALTAKPPVLPNHTADALGLIAEVLGDDSLASVAGEFRRVANDALAKTKTKARRESEERTPLLE